MHPHLPSGSLQCPIITFHSDMRKKKLASYFNPKIGPIEK